VPELPEVETIRRGLAPLVTGAVVVDAGSHPSAKFSPAVEAVGTAIESVDRRGKYLLLGLDDGRRLVVHLGMTGQLRVVEAGDPAGGGAPAGGEAGGDPGAGPDGGDPHDRAWWRFADGRQLRFRDVRRFGRIAVVDRDLSGLPTLAALGPEPFDPAFTPEHLWARLRASRARIKTQLLSQRPVAGVGNIYADEALWLAGGHPAARRLGRPGATRLHAAIVEVLASAIDHGGTTLRDYRTALGDVGGNQLHLRCYGRGGEPCERCGTELRRAVYDGRGTTWCPRCQRR